MDMISRYLEKAIRKAMDSGKAVIVMGARQVGKSTLLRHIFDGTDGVKWYDADNGDVRDLFAKSTTEQLRAFFGQSRYIVIDEAQRLSDAGLTLKRIHDQMPEVQLFATGSSSFELADSICEPLTGRKREFTLYPLSFSEMSSENGLLEEMEMLNQRLLYGYYPEVVTSSGRERNVLAALANDYLYRDLLRLDNIKKSESISNLLKAVAFQIGSPVSYHELGQLTGLDDKTVEKYLDVLEKSYVTFRLNSYSRNLRNELKKSRKIYFMDMGIRNAVINNFTPIESRDPAEVGHMWENFMMAERLKRNEYAEAFNNMYFWRTQQANEIDLLEEHDGQLSAFEIKWNPNSKAGIPKSFSASYPGIPFKVIHPGNCYEFLTI